MSKKKIVIEQDPILRKKSERLEKVDSNIKKLMVDMLETMYGAPGIGLAAVQVGILKRLVVIDISKDNEKKNPLFLINPELTFKSKNISSYEEGCLSLPGQFAEVERPIADAATGRPEFKIVFIVFFKSEVISAIINKICDAFGARQYPVPDHLTLGNASQPGLIVRETTSELADVALLRHVMFCAS